MKKNILLFLILFITFSVQTMKGQNSKCPIIEGVLDDQLAKQAYQAIKDVGMEGRLHCANDGKLLFGFKNNLDNELELQIGFYYQVESAENNSYSLRLDFAKKSKDIYKKIIKSRSKMDKDQRKPRISFRMFLVSGSGTYALGKITYNNKGKAWGYTNEKNRNTINSGNIFYMSNNNWGYTSDIIW